MNNPILLANDKYYAELTQQYNPGDTTLYLTSPPDNVPTLLVLAKGTSNETVFLVLNKTLSSVTNVSRLKGANIELLIQTPITCLNNAEFINQYRSYLGIAWKGTYDADTTYAIQDGVTYLGSSYVNIQAGTNHLPTDTAYWQVVMSKGDTGSQGNQGIQGEAGKEVQLQVTATHIQWKYTDEVTWTDLILLSTLKGDTGDDGLEIELQVTATHIQWQYVGGSWTNLIALSELVGGQGIQGEIGATGASIVSASFSGNDLVFTKDDANVVTLVNALIDLKGDQGDAGTNGITWRSGTGVPDNGVGVDGDFYLRTSTYDIYSRVSGSYSIIANIKGATGENGLDGIDGTNGINGATWRSGTTVPDNALGIDGDFYLRTTTSDIYLKASGNYSIIVNIKGLTGNNGTNGTNGTNGIDGVDGLGVPVAGTTNQVLRKKSGTDNDTEWHTLAKADIGLENADNTSDATKNAAEVTLSNKTLNSPKINENVVLTATATELNKLDGSVPRKAMIYGSSMSVALTPGTTQYCGMGLTDNAYKIVIPWGCKIKNLYTYTSSAPGAGKSYVYTLMVDNVASALTCTLSGTATNEAHDDTHEVTVNVGQRIGLRIVTTAGATAMTLEWAIEIDFD